MQALFSVKESIPCLDAYKKERQRFLPQTCDERAENKAKKNAAYWKKKGNGSGPVSNVDRTAIL
ncbi:MAG: hypothetical protein UEP57_03905 [Oscillospiraceae bacterium]|nr:hypothetical protein [Oscillospiraceae bacterium]